MVAAREAAGDSRLRIVGVIGSPVAHSLSPLLHNTAFAALGISDVWRSYAFEVPDGHAEAALEQMRGADVTGLSVTMPHKAAVAARVENLSDVARHLHAVNCVVNRDQVLYGTNTDGDGFLASLARGAGFAPDGRRCLVVGAGGAARAVVLALAEAGAHQVAVVNRTHARAVEAAVLAGHTGVVIPADDPEQVAEAVRAADLVVNATPVGMAGVVRDDRPSATSQVAEEGGWLIAPDQLHEGQVAVDLVYAPRRTPWLRAAEAAGAGILDGLGMLVHQAAEQLRLWTGFEHPVDAMWQAAEAASPL
jgi:shikimate dehydrogenase